MLAAEPDQLRLLVTRSQGLRVLDASRSDSLRASLRNDLDVNYYRRPCVGDRALLGGVASGERDYRRGADPAARTTLQAGDLRTVRVVSDLPVPETLTHDECIGRITVDTVLAGDSRWTTGSRSPKGAAAP